MLISDVMDELGVALDTIADLRVFPYHADKITPPAAVVNFPDTYDYDETLARGADKVDVPVLVVVGRPEARTARDRLSQYADGSGTASVKAAIEAHVPTAYDSARVTKAEFGSATIAGVTYLAVTFSVEIIGAGAGS